MFRKTPQGTNTFKTSDRMGNPVEGSPGERSPTRGWASVDSPESRRLVAEKMRLVLVLLCLHVVVFQILAGGLIYLDGGDVRGILVSLVRYPLPGTQYCVGPGRTIPPCARLRIVRCDRGGLDPRPRRIPGTHRG